MMNKSHGTELRSWKGLTNSCTGFGQDRMVSGEMKNYFDYYFGTTHLLARVAG
jgi:hypothetical protein